MTCPCEPGLELPILRMVIRERDRAVPGGWAPKSARTAADGPCGRLKQPIFFFDACNMARVVAGLGPRGEAACDAALRPTPVWQWLQGLARGPYFSPDEAAARCVRTDLTR